MKKLLALTFACATLVPSALASSPWDGTWKLDLAKSHFEGPSFTYTKLPNNMWSFSDGAQTYKFALDGKPYRTLSPDDTVTATASGSNAIDFVFYFKDTVRTKLHEELSPGGNTITDHATGTRPDGTEFDNSSISKRVSGTSGFAGRWKSTEVRMSSPDAYDISTAADGVVTWSIPAYKETVVGKADGTAIPITGPTVSDGLTLTLKKTSPTQLEYIVKMKEKALDQGRMSLSADGKWLTDISWTPGKPSEKTTAMYEKQ